MRNITWPNREKRKEKLFFFGILSFHSLSSTALLSVPPLSSIFLLFSSLPVNFLFTPTLASPFRSQFSISTPLSSEIFWKYRRFSFVFKPPSDHTLILETTSPNLIDNFASHAHDHHHYTASAWDLTLQQIALFKSWFIPIWIVSEIVFWRGSYLRLKYYYFF